MKSKLKSLVGSFIAPPGAIAGALVLLASSLGLRAAECVSITCPTDIVVGCQGEKGAEVAFAPQAGTSCGTTIEVVCTPPSGSVFPIGTNLVQCVVSDPRGNMARCDFRVIVTNTPPVIECPGDIFAECQSPLGATVTFNPVASAGCDAPVTITCIPPSGSVFPIGTNSVQCVATDVFGRMARCEFRVIVTNGPPTIVCPANPVTISVGPNCKAVMPLIPVTVLERCTPSNQLVFAQSPPAGTLVSPGEHTVTIWVSEGNHLDANCTVKVHVVDSTPPQISCPTSIWKYCAPNGTNAFFDVTATDACGLPVTVTCEPPSGSFFPAGSTQVKCTATDVAGNSSECTFLVNVTAASQLMSFVGGKKDNYAAPADPPQHSACLLTAAAGLSLGSSFDVSFPGRWLGHSFENLPGGIQWAKVRFKMHPMSNKASNDVVRIGAACGGGFSTWIWSAPIASLPEAGGQWTVNGDTYFTLDLSAMPGAPAALLALLNLETTHRLDVLVGDDTVVDWVELNAGVCGVSGAVGGVPYVLNNGQAARAAEGGIRFSSDNRLPFDVDINVGKAEGIEIEFGDWPGATNPPISECSTPVGSLEGTQLEWKPDGNPLCTVQFTPNIASTYANVLLTQPTNISGGRGIEVWRQGQMVSRYFVEDGDGPGGVVLRDEACLLLMGFGQGDFFMALHEASPVSLVNAKHISGESEPMMGDFIRLIFNIPFTVGGNDRLADFDPDWVLNIEGSEMKAHRLNVRKFGGLFEIHGEGLMSVGDDVVVAPGAPDEWTVSTCYTPAMMGEDANNTHLIALSLADLFAGKEIKPGAAFDLVATAEIGTTPPIEAVIGRMRCEILSVDPVTTRFRVNYADIGEETDLALFQLYNTNTTSVPSHQELDVMGAPDYVKMYVHDNYPIFYLEFDAPSGVEVLADGQSVKEVETAWFNPSSPPPGLHGKPYRFCVTPLQAWEQKPLTFSSPVLPPPPPPLAPCVTLHCPTNVVTWSHKGEGVDVRFEVEARSTCGTNVTIVCDPPSGSEFPVGVTWVQCAATDELGNSARCRFPVLVYDREPTLAIERDIEGTTRLFYPAEFHDWHPERARDLRSTRWERLRGRTETDGERRFRTIAVGDPHEFFRLRAP